MVYNNEASTRQEEVIKQAMDLHPVTYANYCTECGHIVPKS